MVLVFAGVSHGLSDHPHHCGVFSAAGQCCSVYTGASAAYIGGGGCHVGSEKVQKHSCGRNRYCLYSRLCLAVDCSFQVESIGGVVGCFGNRFLVRLWNPCGYRWQCPRILLHTSGLFVHMVAVFLMNQAPALMPFQNPPWHCDPLCHNWDPFANRRFLIRETQQRAACTSYPEPCCGE